MLRSFPLHYFQTSLTSFNTGLKKFFLTHECGNKPEHKNEAEGLKPEHCSTFILQNNKILFHACVEGGCFASSYIA